MLINCIECGKQVSDTVTECIHCQGNPRAVRCALCSGEFPKSRAKKRHDLGKRYGSVLVMSSAWVERHKWNPPYNWARIEYYYHTTCLEQFIATQLNLKQNTRSCSECHHDLWQMIPQSNLPVISLLSTCSSCGKNIPVEDVIGKNEDCDKCGLPIYSQLQGYCQVVEMNYLYGSGKAHPKFDARNVYHWPLCSTDLQTDPELEYIFYSQYEKLEKRIERQRNPKPDPILLYGPNPKKSGCMGMLVIALTLFLVLFTHLYIYA
jgi:hypothetical protein